jgi:phospholipid/cholesterol/gamma-HCH transport system substrate-binding protein
VRNLETFVSALTSSSELLASFNKNLANITTVMTNTPNEWGQAIAGLDGAVNDLRPFVAENREAIGTTFDHLNAITTALNDSRRDIKQTLHVAPDTFQNFLNIYQPAQSAVTGILAPVNFADTVQFLCGAIESAGRVGAKQSARLCEQYLSPIMKNRQYNFPPLGFNPFVGASARPNEITYSEDKLNPHIPPPGAPGGPPADAAGPPPTSPQALPGGAVPPAPAAVRSTDPNAGLPGLMVPAAAPLPPKGAP